MNEDYESLISNIQQERPVDINQDINRILATKVSDILDQKRQDLSQSMFGFDDIGGRG